MDFVRIYAVCLRQYYLIRDNLTRFFQIFSWIVVDILLWGFISRYLTGVAGEHFNFTAVLLGAVVLWDFLVRIMFGVTTSFFEDVWSRNFLNIFGSPLTVAEYLAGLVGISIATGLAGLLVMLALAGPVFGFSVFAYGAAALPFFLILFLSGITLGILGIAIVLRFGPSAEWFIWPIPAFISPFVGVFYPLATLPEWMQYIGYLLPPSYVFEGIRSVVAGGGLAVGPFAVGLALSVAYVVLAYAAFMHVYRRAVRTGLIARYSAESVS